MAYFSYHGKIKKLIADGELVSKELVENWNGIKPALVLHFKNDRPMPVRVHRFNDYLTNEELELFQRENKINI